MRKEPKNIQSFIIRGVWSEGRLLNGLKRIKPDIRYHIPDTKYERRAFTLIEMLVFLAVFTLLMGAVAAFLLWTIRANVKSRAAREAMENARRTFEAVTYEIRSARTLYTPTMTLSQISLETAIAAPAGEATTYVDVYRCGSRVCLKREGAAPVALTAETVEVTNMAFRQIGTTTPAVEMGFSVAYKNPGAPAGEQASFAATTTTALRGY